MATISPASRARRASRSDWSGRSPRSTLMPAEGAGQLADHRCVEDLLLPEEAHRPADARRHDGQRDDVEVAAVVGGQDHRPSCRYALYTVDVEARIGEELGAHHVPQQVVGLDAPDRRHAGRAVPALDGPAVQPCRQPQPAVRVHRPGTGRRHAAAAGRRRCRSRRSSGAGRSRARAAKRRAAASLPADHTNSPSIRPV